MLQKLSDQAKKGEANLVLMGIEPTYPSEKYGYIIPTGNDFISDVKSFKEKPQVDVAREYIAQGALWNGGVFAYKLSYVLDVAKELLGTSDYRELYDGYQELKKISFDYAVVEQEKSIQVMRFVGEWKDLGTWNTLTEAMSDTTLGDAQLSDNCENVHVINELAVPVFAMGLKDVVIAAGPDGILVSDKDQSSFIKPYVDQIVRGVMFAEKSWGTYYVLDQQKESLTIRVTLYPEQRMNYHSHAHRDEVWTVVSGTGWAVLDGEKKKLSVGDVISMPAGCRHTVIAETELKIIEVQLGKDIDVKDKEIFEL